MVAFYEHNFRVVTSGGRRREKTSENDLQIQLTRYKLKSYKDVNVQHRESSQYFRIALYEA